MNTTVKSSSEIVVNVPDEVGVLSKISSVISDKHILIQAICGYGTDGKAHVRLITDDNEKALTALNDAGFNAKEHGVIISEVAPHFLHPEIADILGNYEVENNYWCAATHSGEHALLIFSPADNIKAAGVR